MPGLDGIEAASRLRDAAEMGGISGVVSVVHDLESRSSTFAPYKDRIVQLAEDFDFDGVLEAALDFEEMGVEK